MVLKFSFIYLSKYIWLKYKVDSNILIMWGTICQPQMLLPRLWRWRTVRCWACLILSECYSADVSYSFKKTWFWDLKLAWSSKYLQSEWNFLNHLVTILNNKCFRLLLWHNSTVWNCKASVLEFDYVVHSSGVALKNQTRSEAMHVIVVH